MQEQCYAYLKQAGIKNFKWHDLRHSCASYLAQSGATLLQIADGLFPAGAFAHSLGLETYTQAGVVKDRDRGTFIRSSS